MSNQKLDKIICARPNSHKIPPMDRGNNQTKFITYTSTHIGNTIYED
jgi:hypothetical protein